MSLDMRKLKVFRVKITINFLSEPNSPCKPSQHSPDLTSDGDEAELGMVRGD